MVGCLAPGCRRSLPVPWTGTETITGDMEYAKILSTQDCEKIGSCVKKMGDWRIYVFKP